MYHILEKIFGTDMSWVHSKGHQRSHDGRAVYFAIKNFYLGKDHVNRMATEQEQALQNLSSRAP